MSVWDLIARDIEAYTAEIRSLPVVQPVTPGEIRADLEPRYSFDQPLALEDVVRDVARLLRRWQVQVTHPRYFGLFNPSVHPAGIAADALAALYNPQLAAWSHSPAACELERLALRHYAAALGFDPDRTEAGFTSGGAEANLQAALSALSHLHPETGARGVAALDARPAIYLSGESHHSFVKIARMAGLGTDAVREVPVTDRFALDPEALARRIRADRDLGFTPLVVVGTAGTTAAGIVDPLPALAEVAAEAGAWFHVDAAWGGAAALSDRLRPALAGIERADSVTWDAHKWLSVPMGAGMFFCRHPDAVRRAFGSSTTYMPQGIAGASDPYAVSAQWTRRAIGLKVFMTLAVLGREGYRRLIDHQAEQGERLRARLASAGWEVVNRTPLPVVCFTRPEIRSGALATGEILRRLYARGRVWISDVLLGGRVPALRACITSYRTEDADLDSLMDELAACSGAG